MDCLGRSGSTRRNNARAKVSGVAPAADVDPAPGCLVGLTSRALRTRVYGLLSGIVARIATGPHDANRPRAYRIVLSYDPTPLGFVARVAPSWGGQAPSRAEALWGRETVGGLAQGNRVDAEAGYGLPVGSRLAGTPRIGFTTSEYGRDYRVGYGSRRARPRAREPWSWALMPTAARIRRWAPWTRAIIGNNRNAPRAAIGTRVLVAREG